MNRHWLDVARYFRQKAEEDPLIAEGGGYDVWRLESLQAGGRVTRIARLPQADVTNV